MGAVLGSLAELGYGVAYRVLDAQHFGVPQQRRRVFIVGHLGAPFGAAAEVLFEPEGSAADLAACGAARQGVAAGTPSRLTTARGGGVAPTLTTTYAKNNFRGDGIDALILDSPDTHTHTTGPVSTLQGGGKRGYRIDAEAAAGGHLIVGRWPH